MLKQCTEDELRRLLIKHARNGNVIFDKIRPTSNVTTLFKPSYPLTVLGEIEELEDGSVIYRLETDECSEDLSE